MKAWNNDWRPDRWVKQIHKHRMPYLRAYAPPRAETYEKKVRNSGCVWVVVGVFV